MSTDLNCEVTARKAAGLTTEERDELLWGVAANASPTGRLG
jgi:hypothetical protein